MKHEGEEVGLSVYALLERDRATPLEWDGGWFR